MALYYYGARYYNPQVSVWLSVDPLSHLSPNQTPYHFVSNNPVMRIDPDGLTDYELAKNGKISKVEGTETEDGVDRLIAGKAEYKEGKLQNTNYIDVRKGILDSPTDSKNGEGVGFTLYAVIDNNEATEFFEFAANNSDVEWSHVNFVGNSGDDYNYITTSNSKIYEAGGSHLAYDIAKDGLNKLNFYNHSHPVGEFGKKYGWWGPSGWHIMDKERKLNGGDGGDIGIAEKIMKHSPNTKFNIYDIEKKKYIPYSKNGPK